LLDPKPAPKAVTMAHIWKEGPQGGVSGFWHDSIVRLIGAGAQLGLGFRPVSVESGPFLTRARNTVVQAFLRNTDDYLLFTDTDMVFHPQDVRLLLESDAAIAGALYFNAATGSDPWCTALVRDGEDYVPLVPPELPLPPDPRQFGEDGQEEYAAAVSEYLTEMNKEEYGPIPVAGVGMGLTLIKRAVVEAVADTHPKPFEFENDMGEDLTFCLRAAALGFATVVVPQARVGHVKTVVL
jgi:GT2 family glycosyltransferase